MVIFGIIFLVFLVITSLVFSILNFAGINVILDDAYIKASPEEREKMDKKAYRLQSGIIFLLLSIMSLCNLLRAVLHLPWFTYVAYAIAVGGIVYAIISHYALKKSK